MGPRTASGCVSRFSHSTCRGWFNRVEAQPRVLQPTSLTSVGLWAPRTAYSRCQGICMRCWTRVGSLPNPWPSEWDQIVVLAFGGVSGELLRREVLSLPGENVGPGVGPHAWVGGRALAGCGVACSIRLTDDSCCTCPVTIPGRISTRQPRIIRPAWPSAPLRVLET